MKSAFLDLPIQVSKVSKTDWMVLADFRYYSKLLGKVVTVPAKFVTDFASVPRLPLAYLLAGDTAHEAAVIHDWLYRKKPHICTRRKADLVFMEAMKVSKIPPWRIELMYVAVRACGWNSWK